MPKLTYKERCNLYDKVRMGDRERQEWEEGLEVKITPARKKRIECFDEIVRFVEGEPEGSTDFIGKYQGIYHRDEINNQIKKQNQKAEKMGACVKCGQWAKRKSGKTKNGLFYCGYCYTVCFGPAEKKWPATVSKNEKTRGIHRV